MKALIAVAALMIVPVGMKAEGRKACEDLKTEIAAKLDAKGTKNYTLEIVAKDADAGSGKVVGTCDGGANKIIYKHGQAAAPAAAKAEKKEPGKE